MFATTTSTSGSPSILERLVPFAHARSGDSVIALLILVCILAVPCASYALADLRERFVALFHVATPRANP